MLDNSNKPICRVVPEFNSLGKEETQSVIKVMERGLLSGFLAMPHPEQFFGGPEILRLEEMWCKKFSVDYAVSVNSASSGLIAALAAINIGQGDEVIVPPYSMSATAMAPMSLGAVPVFVDIEDDTFGLDPELVLRAITSKTKAIIVVNLFGHAAELKKLRKIADDNNIYLIEDNAQSLLASSDNILCGNFGHIGVFSLNRHKHIHCGEGGICVTNDNEIGKNLILIRNHGENAGNIFNEEISRKFIGYNFRMTEVCAAIASSQLMKVDYLVDRCERIGLSLSKRVEDFDCIQVPVIKKNSRHVFFSWAIRYFEEKNGVPRNEIFKALRKENVPINVGYVEPLYKLPLFNKNLGNNLKEYNHRVYSQDKNKCPVTERLYNRELMSIQIPGLDFSEEDIGFVYKSFKKVLSDYKKFI